MFRLFVSPGMTLLRPSKIGALVELDLGSKNVYWCKSELCGNGFKSEVLTVTAPV